MKYKRIIVNRQRQLEVIEDDLSNPRPGEVRVKILAVGVSFADVSMRKGVHSEARLPLEQAALAQELLGKGETVGKIVLVSQ